MYSMCYTSFTPPLCINFLLHFRTFRIFILWYFKFLQAIRCLSLPYLCFWKFVDAEDQFMLVWFTVAHWYYHPPHLLFQIFIVTISVLSTECAIFFKNVWYCLYIWWNQIINPQRYQCNNRTNAYIPHLFPFL